MRRAGVDDDDDTPVPVWAWVAAIDRDSFIASAHKHRIGELITRVSALEQMLTAAGQSNSLT